MLSKDQGKAFLRETILQTAAVAGSVFSAWLGMVSMLLGVGILKVGLSFCVPCGWVGISGSAHLRGVQNDIFLVIFLLLTVDTALRIEGALFGTLTQVFLVNQKLHVRARSGSW